MLAGAAAVRRDSSRLSRFGIIAGANGSFLASRAAQRRSPRMLKGLLYRLEVITVCVMTDARTLIFEHIAEQVRAIGSAHRIELLEYVAQGEKSVDALARLAGLSLANASHHLALLRRAGFVTARREGKYVFYRLSDGPIAPVLAALRNFTEHSRGEVQHLLKDCFAASDKLAPISRDDLLERMKTGQVVLLDARPGDEYSAGHLPGAVNIQLENIEDSLASLPKDKEFIAYCRGPYCVLSREVVAFLQKKGYQIRRLREGFPEWKAADLPVERIL